MAFILNLVLAAAFLYVLYHVIRTGVRDGMRDAQQGPGDETP
ncbi:hypothetical protein [Demequina maris]|nr:hypothetical protein [Demequina maris]